MIQIGIIGKSKKDIYEWPEVWENAWEEVDRNGNSYYKVTSFSHYFTKDIPFWLDAIFGSHQEYETWYESDLGYLDKNGEDYTDYKQRRERIKQLVVEKGGYEQLTGAEKKIAVEWFAVHNDYIDEFYLNADGSFRLEEKLAAGANFNAGSRASRQARYTAVFEYCNTVLTTTDAMKVMQRVIQFQLELMYVANGFEGDGAINYKGDPDQPSILDFLKGNGPYATVGVPTLGLMPRYGITVEQLIAKCTDIIKHGNY